MPTLTGGLISVNADEADKKLQIVRRYHSEILFCLLFGGIGFLFTRQELLTEKFQKYLTDDRTIMIKQIEQNSEILKQVQVNLIMKKIN